MVRRGPPSNRYRYRRSPRRRLRPVNFRRGRWEFWETRRLASAPPPLPHPWLRGAAPAAGRGPGLPANGSRSLPQGAAAPSRFLGERQVPRTGNRKDKAGQTERGRSMKKVSLKRGPDQGTVLDFIMSETESHADTIL